MSRRILVPGARDRHGIAHPLPHCTGSCHGGRRPCDCATCNTELACDIAPDAERVIQPPIVTPEDRACAARARRNAVALAMAGIAALAALLELFGAREFKL